MQNSDFWIRITSLYGSQTSPADLWIRGSVLRSRMSIVCRSQPSSVVLCIQNSCFSIRIASLYGSKSSFVVCACKTAILHVSMGPRHHLWFFAFITASLAPELQVSMGPRPHLWFCAFTTATLWTELIVSMVPRYHLLFCACKKRD